jgi:hypothetical protein
MRGFRFALAGKWSWLRMNGPAGSVSDGQNVHLVLEIWSAALPFIGLALMDLHIDHVEDEARNRNRTAQDTKWLRRSLRTASMNQYAHLWRSRSHPTWAGRPDFKLRPVPDLSRRRYNKTKVEKRRADGRSIH